MPTGRYGANSVVLGANIGATGSGGWCEVEGGLYQVHAEGTFGGTALTLDGRGPNDATIATVAGISITAPTVSVEVRCSRGEQVRYTLTGGTPSGLYIRLVKVSD